MQNISDYEINEFLLGRSAKAHTFLGAHLLRNQKGEIVATQFSVYAPNATEVRLVADFNNYEGWKHVLSKIHDQGFFRIEIPGNFDLTTYKFEIHTCDNKVLYKADPFGFYAEKRPQTASRVYDINNYEWSDQHWFNSKKKIYDQPLLIYEVHLGSWKQKFGQFKPYNEVVDQLVEYVLDQGFTHIELMPVYEHPLDDSWGYQGTGYFAATSRFGSPKDFMYLVDRLHQVGIGVLMDWVLGHICRDAHGLSFFDGTALYEFEDKKRRQNLVWGTDNLDFSKGITRSFMLSALTFWLDYFHIDGYRIDAVSNLIYYLGEKSNGVNEDALNFIKQLGSHLFGRDDRILFMAEDSTDFSKVTHPLDSGGVGFNYKWNMGFMNDSLSYFKEDPINRKYHHDKITFGLVYAFNEQFILPFSHDEVVHMKGSLVNKMPGDYAQKLANWRLLLTLWMTHPGKKLLFMGQEFASFSEWSFKKELDWNLFGYPAHQQANRFFKDLVKVYKHHSGLYQYDHEQKGFEWSVINDREQSVFAFIRRSDQETLIVILNMTPNTHESYEIGVPYAGNYIELINSDKAIYFGSDKYNGSAIEAQRKQKNQFDYLIKPKLGPLAGMIFIHKK